MKLTGIVRQIDNLGRIVLPMEIRKTLKINANDPIEIWVENETVMLTKHETSCVFCKATQNLVEYNGKQVCKNCVKKLSKEL